MSPAAARLVATVTLLLGLAIGAPSAGADEPMPPGTVQVEVLDGAGNPDTQAGSHPARMVTRMRSLESPAGEIEFSKVQIVEFPTGMGGDANSAPKCPRELFDNPAEKTCPEASQVGVLTSVERGGAELSTPIFNLEPAPDEVASFGVVQEFFTSKFSGRLRPSDYGLEMRLEGTPEVFQTEPTVETRIEFWGVPADHQSDDSLPRRPFLTNPTRCDGPIGVRVRSLTWDRPDTWRSGSGDTGLPLSGCEKLRFAPALGVQLESPVTDTPTGVSLETVYPSSTGADELASSQVKSIRMELPEGMGFSAGAASGLGVCSDAQLAQGSATAARCPRGSKIGSVEIGMGGQSEPLKGNLYLGEGRPGERFRLFTVASGGAVETKLVSAMRVDPATGQLTAVLDDLPQVAFDHLLMHFDGGPRGLLVAPRACGPATAKATFVPYSGGPAVVSKSTVAIAPRPGRRCDEPAPFQPTLEAAISARRGGRPTSFTAVLGRRDGEQLTERFSFGLPAGLSADLAAVGRCADAAITAAACPDSSRVGSAFVEIGSGSATTTLDGNAYLTGPYRKSPFGFALVFAAKLGPFDLGNLVVRAAMKLDPLTGGVTVQSDAMPETFEGIPIRFQQIGLTMDRPGFMRTPTSCRPMRVSSTIRSTEGAVASPSDELSVGACVALPFRPALTVALTDRAQLHRRGKPGLKIRVRSRRGDANMRAMGLSLPAGLRLSAAGLREICARREALQGNCPKGSKVGTGVGRTRMLARPLQGSIFLVQPQEGDEEPEIWAHLAGEGVELNMHSTTVVADGRVENRFQSLPDMPLSDFTMQLASGKHGVFVLDRSLCADGRARELRAPATLEGQNGAYRKQRTPVTTPKICRTD